MKTTNVELKKFNLMKKRDGSRNESIQSYFFGENETDQNMLNEAIDYLKTWLEEYNNSLAFEEIEELFEGFDGSLSYDVWSFNLEEEEETEE